MRYAKATDANHATIAKAFRRYGFTVIDTHHAGGGWPDLACARAGRLVLVEVKDGTKPPSARRLSKAEAKLHQLLRASGVKVEVVTSVAEVTHLAEHFGTLERLTKRHHDAGAYPLSPAEHARRMAQVADAVTPPHLAIAPRKEAPWCQFAIGDWKRLHSPECQAFLENGEVR